MIFDIQKASTLKRASAFLLDLILFAVLAVGVAWLIGLACDYDGLLDKNEAYYSQYKAEYETKFDVDFDITEEQFNALTPEEQTAWKKAYDECNEALNKNEDAKANYVKIFSYTLMMVSLGLFVSMLLLEFVVPLIFKNGQTIGKKVFGIGVIHQNGVRVNTITMFIRAILGKYTVELMVPVLLIYMMFMFGTGVVSLVVIGLILILEIVLFFASKGMHTLIHDVFAKTVCVDIASQMVFENEAEMNMFRRNAYAEKSGEMNSDGIYTGTSAISASLVEKSSLPSSDVPATTETTTVDQSSTDTTTEE